MVARQYQLGHAVLALAVGNVVWIIAAGPLWLATDGPLRLGYCASAMAGLAMMAWPFILGLIGSATEDGEWWLGHSSLAMLY
jgi:hypothetical protein